MTLAALFHPGGPRMALYETDESDVMPIHDYMLPMRKFESQGLRVVASQDAESPWNAL